MMAAGLLHIIACVFGGRGTRPRQPARARGSITGGAVRDRENRH
jgi:hypothetical protein